MSSKKTSIFKNSQTVAKSPHERWKLAFPWLIGMERFCDPGMAPWPSGKSCEIIDRFSKTGRLKGRMWKCMMKLWFPSQNETLYLADTDENSVFAAAKRNFSPMNMLGGELRQPVTNGAMRVGEVYGFFLSGSGQVRNSTSER